MTGPAAQLRLDPEPASWDAIIRRQSVLASSARFRQQLGLPEGTPLVVSGHQAELWHPGILAKHMASWAVAQRVGGAAAWLVVDQDVPHEPALRVPILDAEGRLIRRTLALLPETDTARATGWIAPIAPGTWAASDAALSSIPARLRDIHAALTACRGEKNWAAQVTGATQRLLPRGVAALRPVYASRLSQTDLFRAIVAALQADPKGAIEAYNAAARIAANAELRPLDVGLGELPLWRINARGQRKRVVTSELSVEAPLDGLMPRALLMTALVRLAGCELFIHGTGGIVYDRAMEHWYHNWLDRALPGEWRGRTLAPMVLASATLRLPLEAKDAPQPAAIHAAVWRAHHARHDPSEPSAADSATATRKRELLAEIDHRKKRGESPAAEFRAMHDLLAAHRQKHAAALESLDQAAALMRAQSGNASVIDDRTWSFALHEPEAIIALNQAVSEAFA